MIPKKAEVIIKQVAEEKDIPVSTVDDIVSFYYKEVRKALSSLEHLKINLPGLGSFIIKQSSVEKSIRKYENIMNACDTQTFSNYHNIKNAENKLEKLHKARTRIEGYIQEKKAFRDGKKVE
jgi:nucleoid DNA-binding protein